MSGEETLAQVYREVESPKLKNFKRAAFVVFVYSLLFTSLISFFAVVVFVGFLILSGAVNTAIVGSNGVLNRVSEDGVLPDW